MSLTFEQAKVWFRDSRLLMFSKSHTYSFERPSVIKKLLTFCEALLKEEDAYWSGKPDDFGIASMKRIHHTPE